MLNVFLDNKDYFRYPMKTYPKMIYISRMYHREYEHVFNYYRNRGSRVPTENIISKLVYIVSPSVDLDIATYFKHVDSRAKFVAKQFGISSTINIGYINDSIFYKNSQELLLYTEHDIDIFNFYKVWKEKTPIRTLYTDDTDLDFKLLNGTVERHTNDIAVFEIDVIEMCLMYKFWALERRRLDKSDHPSYFVYNIILPSMMKQHFDITLFNRFMNNFYNNYMLDERYRHPFMLSDYTRWIDSVQSELIRDVSNQPYPLKAIINRIPSVFNYNMLETLFINAPYYNRQDEWVLWMSRLKYITFFLDLLGKRGMGRNREYYNDLAIFVRYLENGNTNIYNRIKGDNVEQVRTFIQKIKEVCGRR